MIVPLRAVVVAQEQNGGVERPEYGLVRSFGMISRRDHARLHDHYH